MSSYQYRKSHCGDKTVVRSSYLHNGISYTGKMSSLYWLRALLTKYSFIHSWWSYNFPIFRCVPPHGHWSITSPWWLLMASRRTVSWTSSTERNSGRSSLTLLTTPLLWRYRLQRVSVENEGRHRLINCFTVSLHSPNGSIHSVTPASWRPRLIPHWQSYSDQARTV